MKLWFVAVLFLLFACRAAAYEQEISAGGSTVRGTGTLGAYNATTNTYGFSWTLKVSGVLINCDMSSPEAGLSINATPANPAVGVVGNLPPGVYKFKVNFAGAPAHGYVTFTIAPHQDSRAATVPLSNPTAVPITYKFYERNPDGSLGALVKTVTLGAGESLDVTVGNSNGNDVVVYGEATNSALDSSGNLIPGSSFTTWRAGVIYSRDMTIVNTPSQVPNTVQNNQDPAAPTNVAANTPQGTTTTVTNNVFDSTVTSNTTALDKATFATGINRLGSSINNSLDRINSSIKAQGAGTGTVTATVDFTALNSHVDAVKASTDAIKAELIAEQLARTSSETSASTSQAANSAALGGSASSKYAAGAALVSVPSGSTPSGANTGSGDSSWTVTMAGRTWNAYPLADARWSSLASFTRTAVAWVVLIGCIGLLLKNTDVVVVGICSAQTTTASAATIAGTGTGYANAVLKAGFATVLIFGAVPVCWAIFTGSIGGLTLMTELFVHPFNSAVTASGGSGPVVQGMKLLDAVMPVDLSIVSTVTVLVHKFTCQSVTVGLASGMRWIAA